MNVEIINIGTELLMGEIVNTNATYLQKMCRDLGFNVYYQSVVGDNEQRIMDCLKLAFDRGANCVITTGGLGPTPDDLSKELSAQFLGLEMIFNQEEAKKVKDKCEFITLSQNITDNNYKQAYFPKDAYILENKAGTANGCVMKKDDKMIINLPGPPRELKHVVETSLLPYLMHYKEKTIYTYEFTTMFIGESRLADTLADIIDQQDEVSIALYAGEITVRVRLAVKANSQKEADELMKPVKDQILSRISQYIIEDDLEGLLKKTNKKICFNYLSDFRFEDEFLNEMKDEFGDVVIRVESRFEELGEIVCFTFNDDYSFEVASYGEAVNSIYKIKARFIAQIYQYITRNK